jgi:uncharacterized damage-inducible protein DinB
MTADEFASHLANEAANEMAGALARIKHCVNQLSEEQIWQRSQPKMNSIGNVLLHLCGNVRQWIVSGIGGAADVRNRPAEFAERGPIAKIELLRRLDAVVADARAALIKQTAEQLLSVRRIQGENVTGLQALFNSVPHFRGHTQEIIYITRLLLGDDYQFAWKPSTIEEGAP